VRVGALLLAGLLACLLACRLPAYTALLQPMDHPSAAAPAQGHYHKGLMSHAEAMLEDDAAVSSLSVEELHTLIDAFNNLGMVGPGISAAAARLGRETPTIK
jgi:hypothetical protein